MGTKSLSLLYLAFFIASLSSFGKERMFVRFTQTVNNSQTISRAALPEQSARRSPTEGAFNIITNSGVPDSIFYGVEMASKLWQTKINNTYPISLQVEFEKLNDTEIFQIELAYQDKDGILYPEALYSHLFGGLEFDIDYPNAILILNSSLDWNCSFDANRNVSGYNVLTQALRAISICYGFGSSIINEDSVFRFYNLSPTIFDKHLFYSSTNLNEYSQSTDNFKNIVLSNNVEFRGSRTYNMASENEYCYNQLLFLNNENSLMHSGWRNNAQWHCIDNNVIQILKDLGWNIESDKPTIFADDLDETGYGSAYTKHSFHLESNYNNATSFEWTFSLKKKNGDSFQIIKSNSQTFTIPAISSIEDYYIDINGNLCGNITCSFIIDGTKYSATPYSVSLGIKPIILSIENIQEIELDEEYKYRLDFVVNYRGADYVTLMVEEKNNTIIRSKLFNEPILAHILTGDLSHLRHTWIDVKISNEFGSTIETIEMPIRLAKFQNKQSASIDIHSVHEESQASYKIYNLNGLLIQETANLSEAKKNLPSGIYILVNSSNFVSKIAIN